MVIRKDLNNGWQFTEGGGNNWKGAKVPGCFQMDLMARGKLPDLFYRMNEQKFIDLESLDWDYKNEFILNKEDFSFSQINLVFEGLDTFADIYLNDKHLGRTENMFIPYTYNVSDILRAGKNTLFIHFDSPVKTERTIKKTYPSSIKSERSYIRKAQYSFGWDWGPRVVQTGIWRKVHLEFIDKAKLVNPFVYTEKIGGDCALVNASCEVLKCPGETERLEIETTISFDGREVVSSREQLPAVKKTGKICKKLKIKKPRLWYPNGMGGQDLYEIKFSLFCGGKKIDAVSHIFGLKTVKLIQKKDSEGKSFIFEINGIKTFCKGANWIPADNLLPALTKQDYYGLVKMAKDANMNMLRVWGGGIYEDEAFYNACTELGIMVWQDFMYACDRYPDEFGWFRKLARTEADSIVKKLRNHTSIAIWCGNNENNWGFHSWWGLGDPEFLGNYIYKKILPEVCAANDPSRPYWVSSPYGGKDPNSEGEGDRHSWEVWSGWENYDAYTKDTGRFLSEFGFQAMPDWKTVLSFTEEDDRKILNQVMISHNKQKKGTERIFKFMMENVGLPKGLRNFTYLSQFNQSEALRTGVEHWRNRKFKTSGALFWQLNDCWPVASWSCIDYYKRKKALWYYSRRFFANILPYLKFEEDKLLLTIVNDFKENKKAKVTLKAYKLDGKKVWENVFKINLPGNDVTGAKVFRVSEFVKKYNECLIMRTTRTTIVPHPANKELFDTVIFVDVEVDDKTYSNYFVFDKFRNLDLGNPRVKLTQKNKTLYITSDKPVFGFFIEPENNVDCSDNCLILEPGKSYEVNFSDNPGRIKTLNIKDMTTDI
jgi:beta-mannosidase